MAGQACHLGEDRRGNHTVLVLDEVAHAEPDGLLESKEDLVPLVAKGGGAVADPLEPGEHLLGEIR